MELPDNVRWGADLPPNFRLDTTFRHARLNQSAQRQISRCCCKGFAHVFRSVHTPDSVREKNDGLGVDFENLVGISKERQSCGGGCIPN